MRYTECRTTQTRRRESRVQGMGMGMLSRWANEMGLRAARSGCGHVATPSSECRLTSSPTNNTPPQSSPPWHTPAAGPAGPCAFRTTRGRTRRLSRALHSLLLARGIFWGSGDGRGMCVSLGARACGRSLFRARRRGRLGPCGLTGRGKALGGMGVGWLESGLRLAADGGLDVRSLI